MFIFWWYEFFKISGDLLPALEHDDCTHFLSLSKEHLLSAVEPCSKSSRPGYSLCHPTFLYSTKATYKNCLPNVQYHILIAILPFIFEAMLLNTHVFNIANSSLKNVTFKEMQYASLFLLCLFAFSSILFDSIMLRKDFFYLPII